MQSFLFVAAVVACASSAMAFAPVSSPLVRARTRSSTRAQAPKMALEALPMMQMPALPEATEALNNLMLLASNESDFGGYAFPALGLGGLFVIILYLSPPLAD